MGCSASRTMKVSRMSADNQFPSQVIGNIGHILKKNEKIGSHVITMKYPRRLSLKDGFGRRQLIVTVEDLNPEFITPKQKRESLSLFTKNFYETTSGSADNVLPLSSSSASIRKKKKAPAAHLLHASTVVFNPVDAYPFKKRTHGGLDQHDVVVEEEDLQQGIMMPQFR